jgi:exopolyphosphatase/guanosine-5'-triphosphate,3'-diphosphate pyrophosphatase
MKIAAIDIGTNSTRLLVSEFKDSLFHTLEREMEINRIGKNLGITKEISSGSAQAVSNTLVKYKGLMRRHGVAKYRAAGTSAVRKAKNSQWFISYIRESTGIEIETITGEEEAILSFYGGV